MPTARSDGQLAAFTDEIILFFIAGILNSIFVQSQNEWHSHSEKQADQVSSIHQWVSLGHVS